MMAFFRKVLLALALVMLSTGLAANEVKIEHGGLTLNANLKKTETWPKGPVVLLTHGTLAHRGMEIISGLQAMLSERAISSLAINLSLGLDDRPAGMYECPTPHTHKHKDAIPEIGAWMAWLKGQGVEKVSLLGHSRGGNQTALFAANNADPAIERLFLLAPQTWSTDYIGVDYQKRYGQALEPILEKARTLAAEGKGSELMGPMGFIYCDNTRATADAVASYYTSVPDMDTPHVLPRIQAPVVVFAGSNDKVVAGLVEKMEPLADGERIQLVLLDGADHFFRDLYAEEIADVMEEMLVSE